MLLHGWGYTRRIELKNTKIDFLNFLHQFWVLDQSDHFQVEPEKWVEKFVIFVPIHGFHSPTIVSNWNERFEEKMQKWKSFTSLLSFGKKNHHSLSSWTWRVSWTFKSLLFHFIHTLNRLVLVLLVLWMCKMNLRKLKNEKFQFTSYWTENWQIEYSNLDLIFGSIPKIVAIWLTYGVQSRWMVLKMAKMYYER